MRAKVSVYIATSIDGYIARTDGSLDWLDIVQVEGQDYGFNEFFDSVDTIIMGRKTYDTVLTFPDWPFATKKVIVLTHRKLDSIHGETTWAGSLSELINTLPASSHAYLDGGNVISQGLREEVVDEITISRIPIILGNGRPLFEANLPEKKWKLMHSRSFSSGLSQTNYSAL